MLSVERAQIRSDIQYQAETPRKTEELQSDTLTHENKACYS